MTTSAGLVVTLLVMGAVAGWQYRAPGRVQPVTGPLAAMVLLLAAGAAGISAEELGLGTARLAAGAAYATCGVVLATTAYAIVLLIPATRRVLRDAGPRLPARSALYTALVAVPLATVLVEEVAFRGVVFALLARDHGWWWATVGSSLLFGVWHVLPGRDLTPVPAQSRGWRLARVVVTVGFTTAAGVVLVALRRGSGSLLAPIGWHWAVNGLGVLATTLAWARGGRPTATGRADRSQDGDRA